MKNRTYLLSTTAFGLAAVVSTGVHAQSVTVVDGNGKAGTVVTKDADPTLVAKNPPVAGSAVPRITGSDTKGSAAQQTVYSGFRTAGGDGSGGGGGLGGVFFVDQGTSLALTNVSFTNNTAVGGQGGGAKTDSAAPFAFPISASKTDASAATAYQAVAGAKFTGSSVNITSLTVAQNSLYGVGSGVAIDLGGKISPVGYQTSVKSVVNNFDGTQTVTFASPIPIAANSTGNNGLNRASIDANGNWTFGANGPLDVQPGMTVVGTFNAGGKTYNIPDGVVVDQVQHDGNGKISSFTAKYAASGSAYALGTDTNAYVITAQTFRLSRFQSTVKGSTTSDLIIPTGALGGFIVGQTVTGTGVDANTTVTAVVQGTDESTGNPIQIVKLSKPIDLSRAYDLKAAANPVVAGSGGTQITLPSVDGLAVNAAISGVGIESGTTITAIDLATNTVTLSQPLNTAAINSIIGSSLVVTVNPVVSYTTNSVTLVSVNGFTVGDAISGPHIAPGSRITGIDPVTRTITYTADASLAAAGSGGAMNGLVPASSAPGKADDGRTGTSYAATFDDGEGSPGSNAKAGAAGALSSGGDGGNGGSGSNGSRTNKTLITTVAFDIASLIADGVDIGAATADPLTLPLIAGLALHTTIDVGHLAFDSTQLVAWQIAEQKGLVALGGQGGAGGAGGAGDGFFGGGMGGAGGNGGKGAESYTIGGEGGDGGAGGAGAFGAGGGNGGAGGLAGPNGVTGDDGAGGAAGFGGGTGSSNGVGGQGGSGFGGAIFVRGATYNADGSIRTPGGTLTISGDSVFQNNVALAGSSSNGGATGQAAGGDLFMMKGSKVTLSPGVGHTITFYDSIADDSASSIAGSIAAGQGTPLYIGGGGTVRLFGTNTYSGATTIGGATVEAQDGVGINPYSQILFTGAGTIGNLSSTNAGILLSGGAFTRTVGTGPTNVTFDGSGGFAGTADGLRVNLGSPGAATGATLGWGTGGFVPVGKTLVFGSDAADAVGTVTLQNAIDLKTANGRIALYHNAGATAAYDAAITGAITNGTLTVGDTGYGGTLLLTGQNALGGFTLNAGTVSTIGAAQVGRLMDPAKAGPVTVNGGTLQLGGAETLGRVTVGAQGSLLAVGPVKAGAIANGGISAFGSTLNAASIDNEGVLGLLGPATVAGAIFNEAGGTLRQLGATKADAVTNMATWSLGADLAAPTVVNNGRIDVVGTVAGGVESAAVRTIRTGALTGVGTSIVNVGGIAGTVGNTLVIDQSGASTYAGAFTGAGSLTKAGAGALTLTGPVGFAGDLAVTGGTLTLTSANGYRGRTRVAAGATLALTGTGTIAASSGVTDDGLFSIAGTTGGAAIASLAGRGAVDLGARSLTLTNAADTFAGVIRGTGGLAVAGGTETLTGVNTYTGATLVAAPAKLALTGDGSIAGSRGLVVDGTFDIGGTANGAVIATLAGSGALALGDRSLTLTAANGVFAGTSAGTGGLAVAGGTETLTGVNGYTGRTTIVAGATLALADAGSIATSSAVVDDGRFDIGASGAGAAIASLAGAGSVGLGDRQLTLTNAADTFAGTIDGSGGITLAGGTEYLGGVNSYTGATLVNAGATLGLAGNGAIEASAGVLANGTFAIDQTAAGARIARLGGSGAVALGDQILTLTAAADTFAGGISGNGGLTVAGGTETLTGASTYTGATSVATGAGLVLAGAGSIAGSRTVTVDGALDISQASAAAIGSLAGNGAVLIGDQGLRLTAASTDFGGTIAGTGGLEVVAGTQTLTGTNLYGGRTLIDAGAGLALAGTGSIGASSGVSVNGTLDLTGAAGTVGLRRLDGTGRVALGTQQLAIIQAAGTYAGTIAGPGSLAILGGTQTLTGTSSYAGGTTVGNATLAIGGDAALGAASGPLTLANATLRFLAPTTSSRTITLAGRDVLDTNGNLVAVNGTVGGAGTLVAAGAGTLSLGAANAYAGGTQVVGGTTLRIGSDAALGAPASALLITNGTLQAGADVSLGRPILVGEQARFDGNGHVLATTGTLFGQNGGGYDALATGGFRLTGILDVTPTNGFTLAPSSTLRGTGTFNRAMLVRGTLAPGNSPGTMTFTAPVTIAPGGTLSIDIDGTGTGTGAGNYSRLVLTGAGSTFTAGGTFRPVLRGITGAATNTYTPPVGQSFAVVQTPNAVVGSFAGIEQPASGLLPGSRFDLVYGNNVTAYVTPADYANLSALGTASTQNQAAVGTALNALRGTAGVRTTAAVNDFLGTVFSLNAAQVAPFEDRIAGGIYGDALRLASARAQAYGRVVDAQSSAVVRDGTQLWITGIGEDFDLGSAKSHHTYGVAGGIGVRVRDDAMVGVAAGHDRGDLSQLASGNTAKVDLTHVTAYAAYEGRHAFVRARAGATRTVIRSDRSIPELGATAHGRTDGWGFAGAVEAGYGLDVGGWSLTPSVGVRSAQVQVDAFAETGAGPVALSVDKGRFNGVQSVAKLSVAHDFAMESGMAVRPQLDVAYVHELADRVGHVDETLAIAPGAPIRVDSAASGRDAFRVGAGVTLRTAGHVSVFARGDLDTQANVKARSGSVGLSYRW